MNKALEATIRMVGKKYTQAPISLRVTIGEILSGKIEISIKGGKSDEQSLKERYQ